MSYQKSTLSYLPNVLNAKTEEAKKQLFYNLLSDWFSKNEVAKTIIAQMAMDAEKSIFNIPKTNKHSEEIRKKAGRADTQYRQIIIEFENDIQAKSKREHAEYQLKEYFSGNFNSGDAYDFYLIATDCVRWSVYGVTPESYLGKKQISPDEIELKVIESFVLTEETSDTFFQFIDRYLFRFEKQIATLDSILIDFGDSSSVFINVYGEMIRFYEIHADEPALQTAYNEWKRFMSVAYGSFIDNKEIFVVHSYLSVFAKLIAYEVLTRDNYIDYEEMRRVLNGQMFSQYNISNFVENDFYQWVVEPQYFKSLQRHFAKIAEKISDYEFKNVQSDILKGVYQKLIDLETRHALGEYYTPDWLCESVVNHFDFKPTDRVLDPSCGSGSFLLAATNRLKSLYPNATAEMLARQVSGIDIHPLSVQIAKTTLLLAIGTDLLQAASEPFNLRVYLSNSLLTPQSYHRGQSAVTLFGDEFVISVDNTKYQLPTGTFDDTTFFDTAVEIIDNLASETKHKESIGKGALTKTILARYPAANPKIVERFYDIYIGLKTAKEKGRDSIWKFILQNTYKPFFLKNRFDYIIGNPPWFTYNSIKNAEYQTILKNLADRYDVTPAKKANMPHLEIAAIFMSHCSSYLLKEQGLLAFVVPRAFLTAEHHDNTRSGKAKGFKLTEIWDLQDVDNLFNIPSCVLFAQNHHIISPIPKDGIIGKSFSGRPKQHNATLEALEGRVKNQDVQWYLTKLHKSSALTMTSQTGNAGGENFYKKHFKQGATIVPRNFYFVEQETAFAPIKGAEPNWHNRRMLMRSSKANEKDAKMPWKDLKIRGIINTNYLFRTAIARNIVPFGLIAPPLVLLPIAIEQEINKKSGTVKENKIKLFSVDELLEEGQLETHIWFKRAGEFWEKNKTEKAISMSLTDRLNFQRGLTQQNLNKKYAVLYTASAKDANACMIDQHTLGLKFIVESKAYVFYTDNEQEANFLISFLNSNSANLAIKDFQTRGLFGPRDVHKKILEVALPKFSTKNAIHQAIAALGADCTSKVKDYIATNKLEDIDYSVGQERSRIRKLLSVELAKIDALLIQLILGK